MGRIADVLEARGDLGGGASHPVEGGAQNHPSGDVPLSLFTRGAASRESAEGKSTGTVRVWP
jgi:hypothetical protein